MPGFKDDLEMKRALEELVVALGNYSGYLLLIVPHADDEEIVVSPDRFSGMETLATYRSCFRQRTMVNGPLGSPLNRCREAGEVMTKWRRLNDAIIAYERATGREYTVVLVPDNSNDPVFTTVNGIGNNIPEDISPIDLLRGALAMRRRLIAS